ncbi:MAG: PmoA family protein [Bacteroidia bacterium]|nr:PmoA family protein [Bacteroidia bacterium]
MKLFSTICMTVILLLTGFAAQSQVTAVKVGNRIDVSINGNLFTQYIFSEDEKYPFFFPVNGPSGFSVTSMRNSLYPHHSSLFFGCDRVNGGNYWQEGLDRGQIKSLRAEILKTGKDTVVLTNECIWSRPGAESPVRDVRNITITAPSKDLCQIDFDIRLDMLMDVKIEKTNHSFFSARMAPDLSVAQGGAMVNAEGNQGETGDNGTFGKKSPWMDCYGTRNGKTEGMAILQHPSNPWYPSPWFTRDYGFFSPTPMYWPSDETAGTVLKKGDTLKLRYRVLVHSGDTKAAGIAGEFERYEKSDK